MQTLVRSWSLSLSHKKSLMTFQNTTDSQGRPNGTQPKTGGTKTGVWGNNSKEAYIEW